MKFILLQDLSATSNEIYTHNIVSALVLKSILVQDVSVVSFELEVVKVLNNFLYVFQLVVNMQTFP